MSDLSKKQRGAEPQESVMSDEDRDLTPPDSLSIGGFDLDLTGSSRSSDEIYGYTVWLTPEQIRAVVAPSGEHPPTADEIREALRPFAVWAPAYPDIPAYPDHDSVTPPITAGDIRRAARVLARLNASARTPAEG